MRKVCFSLQPQAVPIKPGSHARFGVVRLLVWKDRQGGSVYPNVALFWFIFSPALSVSGERVPFSPGANPC